MKAAVRYRRSAVPGAAGSWPTARLTRPDRQSGIGLIEVLVAVVVVSFGVLGMASLQLTGMKHSTSGYQRTKALMLADDMATRLRINRPASSTNQPSAQGYANLDTADVSFSCAAPPVPWCQSRPGAVTPPSCNSLQLARVDFFAVACGNPGSDGADQGVLGTLPDGRLQVSCVPVSAGGGCTSASLYQVDVSWSEGSTSRLTADEIRTRRVQLRLRP